MKQLLITIAAVLLVGCGPQPPDISIHNAASGGHIAAIKQHLAAGTDVNAKDDRSNISEGLKFFKIEDFYKATRTSLRFTPDNDPVPGPPPFTIRLKYVLGEYLVEEVDFPMPDGGIKKIKMVIVQLGDSTRFLVHAFDEKILRLALLTKTSENELRCKEVGLNDNGEKISFIGNVVIGKGFLNGEFEVFQNGMLIGKEKSTYEYE